MMGYYGQRAYAGGGLPDLFSVFFLLFWVFAFVDVVLLAFWLWKQLKKK
nr:hypothetical protein [Candidatus Levybacteria bacterium]